MPNNDNDSYFCNLEVKMVDNPINCCTFAHDLKRIRT